MSRFAFNPRNVNGRFFGTHPCAPSSSTQHVVGSHGTSHPALDPPNRVALLDYGLRSRLYGPAP